MGLTGRRRQDVTLTVTVGASNIFFLHVALGLRASKCRRRRHLSCGSEAVTSHEFLQVFAGLKAKMPKAFLIAARSCFLRHRISMACGFSYFGKSVVKTHAKTQTTGDWIKMSL